VVPEVGLLLHVAITHENYARAIVDRTKSIEARFSRTRSGPFMRVSPGDRIFFKARGGPFVATALVERVWFLSDLTTVKVAELRERYNTRILGDAAFWRTSKSARYASFIGLSAAERIYSGPDYTSPSGPRPRCAWYTLPDQADVYPLCLLPPEELTLRPTG
jgi:hypothetical protein